MMNGRLLYAGIAIVGLLSAHAAVALESGFYVGALGGQTEVDVSKSELDEEERLNIASTFQSSFDDGDTGIGVYIGWQFGGWFALEAQYTNLGEAVYSANQTVTNVFPTAPRNADIRSETSSEITAASLSGLITVPIGDQFAFGVRLGVAATQADFHSQADFLRGATRFEGFDESESTDGVSGVYGINFEWDPTPHFGLRLEYQRFKDVGEDEGDEDDDEDDIEGFDVTLLSLSAIGRF